MAEITGIAWAGDAERMGATWSAWHGCTKIGEKRPGMPGSGCDHCYAEANSEPKREGHDRKFGRDYVPLWGKGGVRRRIVGEWDAPLEWDAKAGATGRRFRTFVSSMSDLFEIHHSIQPEWRDHALHLVERCPNIDWQLLTKRIGSVQHLVPSRWLTAWPANCWLGTTVDHEGNLGRIDQLLAVPGGVPVRFLSCEPLLGPLNLTPYLGKNGVNWVIVGGESGTGARPMDLDWARSIRDQCRKRRIAFFYKQPGAVSARNADRRYVTDPESGKQREKWLLDGRAWWQWPGDPVKPGRDTNVEKGLAPSLDDAARQSRKRAMERHRTDGGWDGLITRWLDPLPPDQRREAAEALRHAIRLSLQKP